MPPRYAYWTILVDGQPTAFRSAAQEELLPTFKRLKEKHPSAEMKWFQNGKLWESRVEAQEFMRMRGERGQMGDRRQEGFRDRKPRFGDRGRDSSAGGERRPRGDRPEWKPKDFATDDSRPKTQDSRPRIQDSRPKTQDSRPRTTALDWKPKGEFTPAPKRADRPDWRPRGEADGSNPQDPRPKTQDPRAQSFDRRARSFDRDRKPDWKPKGSFDRDRKPDWKPKGSFDRDRKPDWKPKAPSFDRDRKPDWKSRASEAEGRGPRRSAQREGGPAPDSREKRKWVPKEEYKKAKGIERPRDSKWRPGGEHRDPKQKYKDAKKAKWTKFKKNIRQGWEKKQGRKKDDK